LLDDVNIIVGMILAGGAERAVALDVGLRDGDGEVVVAAIAMILVDALAVFGLAGGGHTLAEKVERVERVGADFLDKHDQGRALARRGGDKLAALEEIVGGARQMVVAAVFAAPVAP